MNKESTRACPVERQKSLPKMLKEKISKKEFVLGALEEELETELRELLILNSSLDS